ncbi:MAG: hypothetical protein OHK0011_07250 [Turneriella sp.]
MAKAKRTTPGTDDKFDAYLRERFAELKRELDLQLAARQPKAGVLHRFTPRGGLSARGGWTVGIAALLLTAVSVPLVMQLNQQREQMRAATTILEQPSAPAARESNTAEAADEETAGPKPLAGKTGRKQQVRRTERIEKDSADTQDSGLAFMKRAQPTRALEDKADRTADSEGTMPKIARAAPAPAATRAAAAEAPAMEQAESRADEFAASGAPAMPEPKTRSAPVNDAQYRLKQAELAEIEKAEMEQLWKEYEKNPALFTKDKKKTERLKLLLARHDTRSRARRMLAE